MNSPLTRRPIRLLPTSSGPADQQLAAGMALLAGLAQTSQPALRWYSFSPTSLLLGTSQRPHEINLAASAAAHVPVHRRRSGGGLVLSQDLLLLDLALPPNDPLASDNLTESYRWIGEVWVAALHLLAVNAQIVAVAEARADSQTLDPLLKRICFAGLSPYEVVASGQKLVGLAQVRRRSGALYQPGIYLRWSPLATASMVVAPPHDQQRLANLLARRVAGLEELLGRPVSAEEVMGAFARALEERTGLTLQPADWSEAELEALAKARSDYAALG